MVGFGESPDILAGDAVERLGLPTLAARTSCSDPMRPTVVNQNPRGPPKTEETYQGGSVLRTPIAALLQLMGPFFTTQIPGRLNKYLLRNLSFLFQLEILTLRDFLWPWASETLLETRILCPTEDGGTLYVRP